MNILLLGRKIARWVCQINGSILMVPTKGSFMVVYGGNSYTNLKSTHFPENLRQVFTLPRRRRWEGVLPKYKGEKGLFNCWFNPEVSCACVCVCVYNKLHIIHLFIYIHYLYSGHARKERHILCSRNCEAGNGVKDASVLYCLRNEAGMNSCIMGTVSV